MGDPLSGLVMKAIEAVAFPLVILVMVGAAGAAAAPVAAAAAAANKACASNGIFVVKKLSNILAFVAPCK